MTTFFVQTKISCTGSRPLWATFLSWQQLKEI